MLEIWLLVMVIACLIEIATQVQLVTLWAAVGALVALITDLFGVDPNVQIIVFFAVTFVTLALTRPIVHRIKRKVGFTPTNADMNVGKIGKVTQIVDEASGLLRVSVSGADWSAVTGDQSILPVGSSVKVERIEGVKLVVSPT